MMKITESKKLITGLVCCLLIGTMTGCTVASGRGEYMMMQNDSDKEKANAVMEPLVEALEEKDVERVKELFSKYALENSDNLDEKIEELMDYYPGYDGEYEVTISTEESMSFGVVWYALHATYDLLKGDQSYEIRLTIFSRNDTERDKIGLYSIQVMTPEAKPEGFKWRNENGDPGVFVLE